jgi:glucosamine kinase
MTAMNTPFLIGIDGGGTGCRVAITDAAGTVLSHAVGGSANYMSDPEATVENVLSTLEAARRSAALQDGQIALAVAHLGLAGILQSTDTAALTARMPMRLVTVSDDRLTSLVGALGARDGVLVSVGTGSFVAKQRGGERSYLGGWGLNIGDQASGAWLGRRLLELCVLVSDGLDDHSDLTRQVLARFDNDPERITRIAKTAHPADYAEYAPQIITAARKGDAHARALMTEGASYLNTCLNRTGLGADDALCLMGSLGAPYTPYLEARFARQIVDPLGTALDGAVSLARQAAVRGL